MREKNLVLKRDEILYYKVFYLYLFLYNYLVKHFIQSICKK